MHVQTLTCTKCGFDFEWVMTRANGPKRCPDCAGSAPRPTLHYVLAANAVNYRIAIEMATAALRMGKPAVALAALEQVEAPARAYRTQTNRRRTA